LGIFLHQGEWRFPLLGFHSDGGVPRGGGRRDIKTNALVPSALEPKNAAIIPQAKLSEPHTQTLSTPEQDGSLLTKESPINVLVTTANPSKDIDGGAIRPEKPRQALPEKKQESTNRANFAVTDNSFVRSRPTSNAEIITTLLPGTRIQVTGRRGEYYIIRSLDKKRIRGYVHKEDAFFRSAR
jgi:hypothetical protein